jgi:hypothetical protein
VKPDYFQDLMNMTANHALRVAGQAPIFPESKDPALRQTFARAEEEAELILEQTPGLREGQP